MITFIVCFVCTKQTVAPSYRQNNNSHNIVSSFKVSAFESYPLQVLLVLHHQAFPKPSSSAITSSAMCFCLQAHCLLCSAFSTDTLSTCPAYKSDTGQCLREGTYDGFPQVPHNVDPMDVNKPLPLHRSIYELALCERCGEEVAMGRRDVGQKVREMLGRRIVRA
jgi:hypothetical protein